MKSAAFEYARPQSVDEVCRLLAEAGGEAQILAGGQSLVPLLATRLARPALLIDINRIAALQGIVIEGDALVIGGCTRQRTVERSVVAAAACPLLAKALVHIGHVQTRNRGTVGGSLCQADPAGEIPLVAVTLGAELTLRGASASRTVSAGDFILGAMETSAENDECLVSAAFPVWREARLGAAFHEVAMRHGDFAMLSAAAQIALDSDGRCTRAALGLGNAGPAPIRLERVAAVLEGTTLTENDIAAALAPLQDEIEPLDDTQTTAAYRRRVAPRMLRRAIQDAVAEASA